MNRKEEAETPFPDCEGDEEKEVEEDAMVVEEKHKQLGLGEDVGSNSSGDDSVSTEEEEEGERGGSRPSVDTSPGQERSVSIVVTCVV